MVSYGRVEVKNRRQYFHFLSPDFRIVQDVELHAQRRVRATIRSEEGTRANRPPDSAGTNSHKIHQGFSGRGRVQTQTPGTGDCDGRRPLGCGQKQEEPAPGVPDPTD